MTLKEENDALLNTIFESLFFRKWKLGLKENRSGIELILDDNCNLKCEYCYFRNPKLFTKKPSHDEIMSNLDKILYWLKDNKYNCGEIAIFSGDAFSDDLGFRVIERILDFIINEYRVCEQVVIPTNGLFVEDEEKLEKFEKIHDRYKQNDVLLALSLSFDGKYVEEFRPSKSGYVRTDDHYDRLFQFSKKHGCGFHPMLYSKAMKNWKKNFIWFQDMMKKHNMFWSNMYLLEVRNSNWTVEECKQLYDFVKFIIKFVYEKADRNEDKFLEFFKNKKTFNILTAPFINTGRGIGCGIQCFFYINVLDMRIVPCHRTMYDCFTYGKFRIEDDKIVGIDSQNVEMANTIYSFEGKTMPVCQSCQISELCNFNCLGSSYETTGDLFTVPPMICRLEHYKLKALIDGFNEVGMFESFIDKFIPYNKREAVRKLLEDGIL